MNKYIDADKLIAEIERLIKVNKELKSSRFTEGIAAGYGDVLSAINSLQHEQPEVDLKEKIHRFIMAYFRSPDYDRDLIAEVDWENSMNECAHHFYELGLNARKEE